MVKTLMYYTAVLVGVYLGVSHATQAGNLMKSASAAYSGGVKTLQGR